MEDQELDEYTEDDPGIEMCEICGALVGEKHVFSCPADPMWLHERPHD